MRTISIGEGTLFFFLLLAVAIPGSAQGTNEFRQQTAIYKKVGSCDLELDIYRLENGQIQPVVLWIHGGALIMGNRKSIPVDQLERMLREGFTVVSIDYRLAPETKLPGIVQDVSDAHQWLRKQKKKLNIDPDRLAVMGQSAGGYLALVSGHSFKPRPKAIVSFYGYGDLLGEWYTKPDPFYSRLRHIPEAEALASVGNTPLSGSSDPARARFYLYSRQQGLWVNLVFGADPIKNARQVRAYCPEENVTSKYPPTFLLHGDKDTDVPHLLSERMASRLKKEKVEHELRIMHGKGHGFDMGEGGLKNPENAAAFEKVIEFLLKHLNAGRE